MPVYVDDMKAEYSPPHAPSRLYIMSHMIADTPEELHAMARKIGLKTKWHQRDHYDVTQTKRALAVKYGALEITWRQAGAMMTLQRRGHPMGDPATAEARRQQMYEANMHRQHAIRSAAE